MRYIDELGSCRLCLAAVTVAVLGSAPSAGAATQTTIGPSLTTKTGAEHYQSACIACHGPDGKGAASSAVGSDMRLPDFSNCAFSTSEPDLDWLSIIHRGGPARALDLRMPAFGEALSDQEIEALVAYLRGFCTNRAWPRGDLNLPRSLVTEKAFPENEAFVVTAVPTRYADRVETRFVYERRIGARSQYEVAVPFDVVQWPGGWNRGLGDIAVAFKQVVFESPRGSILSAGSELTFPTGKLNEGLGRNLTVFEPFGTFSLILPYQAFLHLHTGFEFPLSAPTATSEAYWRAAAGKTFIRRRWGRAWTPIVELLGVRELVFGEPAFWDLLPELHVTLSRRQHVMVNGGVRFPLNLRRGRTSTALVSIQWDWHHSGLFSGW